MVSENELEEGEIEDEIMPMQTIETKKRQREIMDYSGDKKPRLIHPKQINSMLMNSKNVSTLLCHARDNIQSFNYICASAAVSKAAKMINKRSQ